LWRDPWALFSLLSVVALFAHSLGAPLGVPVAEDFDFLDAALFERTWSWWDGGGSGAFWRPVAQQLYFRLLGTTLLAHPAWVTALHVALLALATLAIYSALRVPWSAPWAAFAASFSSLSESSRGLLTWSSHFADLGAWVFTALCLHEVARRRLPTALLALLLALWCKEVAGIAALLLPFIPGTGPRGLRERLRWMAAFAGLLVVWALVYGVVRQRAGFQIYHGIEPTLTTGAALWMTRIIWSLSNGLRAMLSLPAHSTPGDVRWLLAGASLFAAAGVMVWLDRRARERMRRAVPIVAWGTAWYLLSVLAVAVIYPFWAPNRTHYGGFGFAALTAAVLGSAHPVLLTIAMAVKLATFAFSPGPPDFVSAQPPLTGAYLDFEQLVRHQRLARETRAVLQARFPTMPHGATVAWVYLPKKTEYTFGGSRALHVWYRDTTLRFVPLPQAVTNPRDAVVAFLVFEPRAREMTLEALTQSPERRSGGPGGPQVLLIDRDAMWSYLAAVKAIEAGDFTTALAALARADAEHHAGSRVFASSIAGARAVCLEAASRSTEAEAEARRSVALWPMCPDGRFALAWIPYRAQRWEEANAALDTLIAWIPDDPRGAELARLRDEARGAR
jgi:hypothetical protein